MLNEEKLIASLKKHNFHITTAESCTGGLISGALVNVAGASSVFNEGYVTYSNEAKHRLLGVSVDTLNAYGAVSKETAYEMAKGAAKVANANCAIAVTGIAGPDGGTKEKPVGTVYAGYCVQGKVTVERYLFSGSRLEIRNATVEKTIEVMNHLLEKI